MELKSIIRSGSAKVLGKVAWRNYAQLANRQPLLMIRNHTNYYDRWAVLLATVDGSPCGFVAREDAAFVAPRMDNGEIFYCRTRGLPGPEDCPILIWTEEKKVGIDDWNYMNLHSPIFGLDDADQPIPEKEDA